LPKDGRLVLLEGTPATAVDGQEVLGYPLKIQPPLSGQYPGHPQMFYVMAEGAKGRETGEPLDTLGVVIRPNFMAKERTIGPTNGAALVSVGNGFLPDSIPLLPW